MMPGRPRILDAGGDVSDPVRGHLAALLFKPVNQAFTVDEDDLVALDQFSIELVPEDHHSLDETNTARVFL